MYSAGIISSRISDFGGKHYAGRIRHFRAKFEQNNRKSEALSYDMHNHVRKMENS